MHLAPFSVFEPSGPDTTTRRSRPSDAACWVSLRRAVGRARARARLPCAERGDAVRPVAGPRVSAAAGPRVGRRGTGASSSSAAMAGSACPEQQLSGRPAPALPAPPTSTIPACGICLLAITLTAGMTHARPSASTCNAGTHHRHRHRPPATLKHTLSTGGPPQATSAAGLQRPRLNRPQKPATSTTALRHRVPA